MEAPLGEIFIPIIIVFIYTRSYFEKSDAINLSRWINFIQQCNEIDGNMVIDSSDRLFCFAYSHHKSPG